MFKKEQKTIEMVEDTFLKRHAKKFLIAGGIISIASLTYIAKKHGIELSLVNMKLEKVKEIALRSLIREKTNAEFEIAEKLEYIDKLDTSFNINTFVKIPEAERRIQELKVFIEEIETDIKKIEG